MSSSSNCNNTIEFDSVASASVRRALTIMESPNKSVILERNIGHIKTIRKTHGLDRPGCVEEAVVLLDQWLKMQKHFKKRDLPYQYVEATLISSKGEIEKAKTKLEKIYSLRTRMPDYFGDFDIRNDFKEFDGIVDFAILPKLTKDQARIIIVRNTGKSFKANLVPQFTRIVIMMLEYLKMHDYCDGFVLISDLTGVSMMEIVRRVNLEDVRKAATIFIGIYGTRFKGLHLISTSRLMNIIIWILKQVAPAKIVGRIHAHQSIKPVYNHLDSDLLPQDYGGKERPLETLHEQWLQALESEQFRAFQREMNDAVISEECDSSTTDDSSSESCTDID